MTKSNTDKSVDRIDKFHKTKKGRVTFGVVELLVAYLFISLAIDSGSIWQYIAAIILAIGAVNNLTRAFVSGGAKLNGKKSAKKR
jgi:hypothetical protein